MTNQATPITLVRSLQGDTLSGIVWRHMGQSSGVMEAVLDINPHLADMPAVLPAGVAVQLPTTHTTTRPAPVATVRLWD
jgi:phage tail protein X